MYSHLYLKQIGRSILPVSTKKFKTQDELRFLHGYLSEYLSWNI